MKRKRWKITGWILLCILLLYCIVLNIAISALLRPSFMQKLDSFEAATEKGYSQQVYTEDIVSSEKASRSAMKEWWSETPYQKYAITSADGLRLIAGAFLQEDSHCWVFLLHGYTGWKEENYEFAMWYYQHGFNVLAADSRAHGESEGDIIGMGYLDIADNLAWIDAILRLDPEAEIVLHGQSMGAAAALMLTGEASLPSAVKACVADAPYTTAYDMFAFKLKDWTGLPPWSVMPAMDSFIRLRFGYSLKDASALSAVTKSTVPTLLIHGEEDAIVPCAMSARIYDAMQCENKARFTVPGAGHVQSMYKDPEGYYASIDKLIQESL